MKENKKGGCKTPSKKQPPPIKKKGVVIITLQMEKVNDRSNGCCSNFGCWLHELLY